MSVWVERLERLVKAFDRKGSEQRREQAADARRIARKRIAKDFEIPNFQSNLQTTFGATESAGQFPKRGIGGFISDLSDVASVIHRPFVTLELSHSSQENVPKARLQAFKGRQMLRRPPNLGEPRRTSENLEMRT